MGFALSAVSVVIHPFIVVIRTLSSMIRGYDEGTDYDWGTKTEEEDLEMAMAIW